MNVLLKLAQELESGARLACANADQRESVVYGILLAATHLHIDDKEIQDIWDRLCAARNAENAA